MPFRGLRRWGEAGTCSGRPACTGCCRCCSACLRRPTGTIGWYGMPPARSSRNRPARPACANSAPEAACLPISAAWSACLTAREPPQMERKVEKGRGDFGWHAMACWAGQVGGIMASRSRSQRSARPPKRRLPKKRVVKGAVAKARAGKRAVAKIAPGIIEAALAAFAHEVRTPLTGILAISDLLATSDLDERERRWVDTIKAGAEHLSSLATLFVDAAKS